MTVRRATEHDAAALAAIHVGTWQAAYRGQLPQAHLDALDVQERRQQWLASLRRRPAPAVYVAEDDAGAPVGFVVTGPGRDPGADGEVMAIYVRPEHWGRGAGRDLMAAALDRLRADGHAEAVLWVLASNERARRFYEAAGWHADGGSRIEDFAGVPIEELRYRRTVANSVWDEHAATFDDEPDHGLRDPSVRRAWSRLLASVLPPAPASIVDLGCGTGSLSVLAAGQGHRVVGLDGSAAMLRRARGKQPDLPLVRGDVSRPPFAPGSFDVVLVRHVLWAVPDPAATLARWFELGRRLVLIEGRWSTGAGLTAAECTALLRRLGRSAQVRPLTDAALWGKPVTDERYLLVDS